MSIYKTTLITAEILSVILAGIWIVYKIKAMQIDDLVLNMATYSLMMYVAVGNLIEQMYLFSIIRSKSIRYQHRGLQGEDPYGDAAPAIFTARILKMLNKYEQTIKSNN